MEMLSSNSNSFSSTDIRKFVTEVGKFVEHPHLEVQRIAHALLDLVMEFDSVQGTGELFSLAREIKFAAQNEDWYGWCLRVPSNCHCGLSCIVRSRHVGLRLWMKQSKISVLSSKSAAQS